MEHQLDVSELEPCEPLERTIEAIKRLKRGDVLRIVHRREPHLLYPLLEKGDSPGQPVQVGQAGSRY